MSALPTPRIEINLPKIAHNVKKLIELYGSKNIGIMAVTKAVCGSPEIAQIFLNQGIHMLADSQLMNLKRLRDAGISAQYVLLRSPSLSEIDKVINCVDISMNTELSVIKKLSEVAIRYHTVHKIILMIEMGDLREGIMPEHIEAFIQEVLKLPGVKIEGIGANFACFGGVKPSEEKMCAFSTLASNIELKFSFPLTYVSGGNSANYNWFMATESSGKINNVRLGESLYLGRETLNRMAIPGLYTDAVTFIAEVIESKVKPSLPFGEIGQNVFGVIPQFEERGQITRAIIGAGSQDVLVTGLLPILDFDILGSSSDHLIVDAKDTHLCVGDEVTFNLDYGALLTIMTSPYVHKEFIHTIA